MKRKYLMLSLVLSIFSFSAFAQDNFKELTKQEDYVVVKITKRFMSPKYSVRIDYDKELNAQESRYNNDTRLKNDKGHVINFMSPADALTFMNERGFIVDKTKGYYIDHPNGGEHNPDSRRLGTRKIGGDPIVNKNSFSEVYVMRRAGAGDYTKSKAAKTKGSLTTIYFSLGSSTLNDVDLKPVVDAMKANKKLMLRVEGNTDATGSAALNMRLGRDRAQSVVNALVKKYGLSADRFEVISNGMNKPTSKDPSMNRRVDFFVK